MKKSKGMFHPLTFPLVLKALVCDMAFPFPFPLCLRCVSGSASTFGGPFLLHTACFLTASAERLSG